jgi:hypothetical protein
MKRDAVKGNLSLYISMHTVKDENVEGMGARFISSVGQLPSSFDMQYYMRFI